MHAEPHRRVAVLDRPLHRAQRRHRAHPRRAPAAAARGPVDRRGHRPAARCSRSWAARPTDDVALGREDVLALLAVDRDAPGVDRALARLRPRERPPRPRDRLDRAVGGASTTTERADAATRRLRQDARVLPLGARARRRSPSASSTPRRAATRRGTSSSLGRVDRARRHDRAPARDPVAHRGERAELDDDPAQLRRATRPTCAATAACRRAQSPPSSCCSTGCSRGRSSRASSAPRSRCARSTRAPTASASPTRRGGCSGRSAPSSSTGRSPTSSPTCSGHMEQVQAVTSSASEAIRQRYFPASVAPVWIGEAS